MNRRITTYRSKSGASGYSMLEVMIALAIMGFVFAASMSAIYGHRMQMAKDRDLGIGRDFMIHYVELIKALPFDEIRNGNPISAMYNGANGSPDIRIPMTPGQQNLTSADYQMFHPDLVWLEEQNPKLKVVLTTTYQDELEYSKLLSLELTWDPKLGIGSRQRILVDVLRTKDM